MRYAIIGVALAGLIVASAAAQAPTVQISLGVREQDPNVMTGAPGTFWTASASGSAGNIEWFRYDEQTLVLDGTWQQFTFDLSLPSATSFTGNGAIEQDKGLLEHVRIKSNGYPWTMDLWFDRLAISYDPAGPPPPVVDQVMTTFAVDPNTAAPYANGAEVMFQEPGFSGTTNANLFGTPAVVPNVSGIDNAAGYDDQSSVHSQFRFLDSATTRWLRYTTYRAPATMPLPNPVLPLVRTAGGGTYASASVTFWMKGIPEPASLLLLGLGAALLRRR